LVSKFIEIYCGYIHQSYLPYPKRRKDVEKRRQKQQVLNTKRRSNESNCWRNQMLLMKILSLTLQTAKNLWRILERTTVKILLR
jgi:hypothetical protein